MSDKRTEQQSETADWQSLAISPELRQQIIEDGQEWLLDGESETPTVYSQEELSAMPAWLREDVKPTSVENEQAARDTAEFRRQLEFYIGTYENRYRNRMRQLADPNVSAEDKDKAEEAIKAIQGVALRYRLALDLLDKGRTDSAKALFRDSNKLGVARIIGAVAAA